MVSRSNETNSCLIVGKKFVTFGCMKVKKNEIADVKVMCDSDGIHVILKDGYEYELKCKDPFEAQQIIVRSCL